MTSFRAGCEGCERKADSRFHVEYAGPPKYGRRFLAPLHLFSIQSAPDRVRCPSRRKRSVSIALGRREFDTVAEFGCMWRDGVAPALVHSVGEGHRCINRLPVIHLDSCGQVVEAVATKHPDFFNLTKDRLAP